MDRITLNRDTLERCLFLLRSPNYQEISEGIVLASYLVEQALKVELHATSPLLYYDRKCLDDEMEVNIASGKLLPKDLPHVRTSSAKRCLTQLCHLNADFNQHKSKLEELFRLRNYIVHSIADIPEDGHQLAQIAVDCLKCCQELIIRNLKIGKAELNPLTSAELRKIEEEGYKKRELKLSTRMTRHRMEFEQLEETELRDRLKKIVGERSETCPACQQQAMQEDFWGDFEYLGNGEYEGGGEIEHVCRVCGLILSQYEKEMAMLISIQDKMQHQK